MIVLENIGKTFGHVRALEDVSLEVSAGTIHGIIGENGAGKSTLMKILTGFISRSQGAIHFDGRQVELRTPQEAARLGIGMLYQEPLDFPRLTVLENFMAADRQWRPSSQRRILLELCEEFGFRLDADSPVQQLTVGERQQIQLMRLIRDRCRVLILDEPTTGISDRQQQQLFDALRRLRQRGTAILLVSHKLAEVHTLCDQTTVLRKGKVVARQRRPFDEPALLTAMFDQMPRQLNPPEIKHPGAPLLVMDRVESNEGRVGLHDACVTIRQGEMVGLAGLDGSGQNLFLQIAHGLLRPEKGSVHRPGGSAPEVHTFFLPADRLGQGLVSRLTIREHQLIAGACPFLLSSRTGNDQAGRAIQHFSIHGTADTTAENLSGGNQQRLLLSLIPGRTNLLLLENPTRGLDVRSGLWTWEHLRAHVQRTGGAMVYASPDLDEIMNQSTRILVFFNGRIILDRPRKETSYQEISRAITGRIDSQPGTAS